MYNFSLVTYFYLWIKLLATFFLFLNHSWGLGGKGCLDPIQAAHQALPQDQSLDEQVLAGESSSAHVD